MEYKLLWVLSPTCTWGSSPFTKLAFLNPVWVWWPVSCWNLDEHADLVHSLSYVMPHFPGCNHNRHRRVFLSSPPVPHHLLAEISVSWCPSKFLWFDPLHALPSSPPVQFKREQWRFGPDGFPSSDAAECLVKLPGMDSRSTSVVNIRLPNSSSHQQSCHPLLLTLTGSRRGCFLSLLVLYRSPLGQRLGLGPSGTGQGLVWVIVNALILTSGPLWFISPLSWSQLPHLYLSFPWDVFFLRSQVSHANSVLLDCPVIYSSRSA